MTNAIVPARNDELMFMPVMDMEVAISRRNYVVEFTKRIMVEGTDFGKIPGTGDKPTLLKPGAEKLSTFFGLTPVFISVAVEEDWTGADHKGEPFFYYRYRCELHRNGNLIATSEGSCNAWEAKYRYRKAERVCPSCGQATIVKGQQQYGGGWLCFKKKGGCGEKYKDGDAAIEGQEVGRVNNPDMADMVNTVQKMAQKRALVAAVLLAVNASEFYTQDIEDMAIDGNYTIVSEPEERDESAKQEKSKGKDKEKPRATQQQLESMEEIGLEYYKDKWPQNILKWVEWGSKGAVQDAKELMPQEVEDIIEAIQKRIVAKIQKEEQVAADKEALPVATDVIFDKEVEPA